ncbi:NAD-dependent protein deacylase [bacterium]|nr:NAD-dependent protein deacylase [bacterium]
MLSDTEMHVAQALRQAKRVTVLSGAGISAESGLPTFRDPLTGYWSKFRPEDLATPIAFRRNPELVWRWYCERRAAARAAKPNPGHLAITKLQSIVPAVTIVTQNVDGLHQSASSTNVIELHGSIHATRCFDRDHVMELNPEEDSPDRHPACPLCGSLARPGVVWFGEMLPEEALARSISAANECDVMLVVGTSGIVQPAASLGSRALSHGAVVAVVNPDPRSVMTGGVFLEGPAGSMLPRLIDAAWPDSK